MFRTGFGKRFCRFLIFAFLFTVNKLKRMQSFICRGWLGGAKVLDKLPVPGRPTNLDYSRARAYCTCNRCGWGGLDIFTLIYHPSFLSPFLWETVVVGFSGPLRQYFSLYQAVSQREGERGEKGQRRVKLSKQPPPALTASAIGPWPTIIQIVGRPGTGSLHRIIAPPNHNPGRRSDID